MYLITSVEVQVLSNRNQFYVLSGILILILHIYV